MTSTPTPDDRTPDDRVTAPVTTARQVADCLTHKWPDGDYLHIDEAPTSADRAGRKLDVLIMSVWGSRGFERDGVEIKVSVADWRRELKNPAKANWWYDHVHRFWIAAPTTVAEKIVEEVPVTWGVLSCSTVGVIVLRKAPRHDPEVLPQSTWVGLLRAGTDSGLGALRRAEDRGYGRGYEAGQVHGRNSVQHSHAAEQFADLAKRIAEFTEASGVDPREHWSGPKVGQAFKLAMDWTLNPTAALDRLLTTAAKFDAEARRFEQLAKGVYDELVPEHPDRSAADQLAALLRAVLDRHQRDEDGDCTGCGFDAYETAYPWPCWQLAEVRRALGRALPDVDDELLHQLHPDILTGTPTSTVALNTGKAST